MHRLCRVVHSPMEMKTLLSRTSQDPRHPLLGAEGRGLTSAGTAHSPLLTSTWEFWRFGFSSVKADSRFVKHREGYGDSLPSRVPVAPRASSSGRGRAEEGFSPLRTKSEETPQKHPSVCELILKGESGAAASLNSEEASKRALGSEDLEACGWYLSGENLGSTGPHYTVDPKCSLHEDLLGQPGQRTH